MEYHTFILTGDFKEIISHIGSELNDKINELDLPKDTTFDLGFVIIEEGEQYIL